MPILLSLGRFFGTAGRGLWGLLKQQKTFLNYLGISTVASAQLSSMWEDIKSNPQLQLFLGIFSISIILVVVVLLRKN